MTDKELDDLFTQSFAGHQAPVPGDMWQRIKPDEKKRRGAFWWWTGLGVAALFLITGTAIWLSAGSSETSTKATASSSSSVKEKTTSSVEKKATASVQNNANTQQLKQIFEPGKKADETVQSSKLQLKKQKAGKEGNLLSDIGKSGIGKRNKKPAGISTYTSPERNKIQQPTQETGRNKADIITSSGEEKTTTKPGAADSNTMVNDEAITTGKQSDSLLARAGKTTKPDTAAKQSTPAKTKQKQRVKAASIELMIAGYGDTKKVYGANPSARQDLATLGAINPEEKTKLYSSSFTIRINKPITKNLSFKTGLQFLQTHQRVAYHQELVSQFAVVSSLTVSNDTTRSAEIHTEKSVIRSVYNSVSVPLILSYQTNGSKINVGASAGILLNVASWYRGKVPNTDYRQTVAAKNVFKRNTGTAFYASLQTTKQIGNWQLFAEPSVQYSLSSLTKRSVSFKQKMTYYGFGIGIRKSFGK